MPVGRISPMMREENIPPKPLLWPAHSLKILRNDGIGVSDSEIICANHAVLDLAQSMRTAYTKTECARDSSG